MRVRRKGAVCGLSLSLQFLKRLKKNSCYCASLPSSYIPIFPPPPPLTPLNYITIDQNSKPTFFTHSFITSFLLVSAYHFCAYHHPHPHPHHHHHDDGSPEYLGISGNMEHREMGCQGNENPSSWMFDEYNLMEDISVTSLLDPTGVFASTSWPSPPPHLSFSNPTSLSMEQIDDSFPNSDGPKEISSRKRVRSGSCTTSGSKACREKMRRDRLNDRFMELGSILDPGRPPKMDKAVILGDAVRMLTQLRDESQKLKESKMDLQEKINELKAEKNELRDEKQRLKVEKENLEKNVKALSTQPGYLPHPPAIPAPFSAPGQVVGSKLVPFMGYPGVSMWQFMPPASVDTSQDHVLRPPVA